jgi:hypothetical protein
MGDRLVWAICAFVGVAAIILTALVLHLAAEKFLEHRMRSGRSTADTAWEGTVSGGDIESTMEPAPTPSH